MLMLAVDVLLVKTWKQTAAPLVTAHLVIINETVNATIFYGIWRGGFGGALWLLHVMLKLNQPKPNEIFLLEMD